MRRTGNVEVMFWFEFIGFVVGGRGWEALGWVWVWRGWFRVLFGFWEERVWYGFRLN